MTRTDENLTLIRMIGEDAKPEGTYEELVVWNLGAISSLLGDISKSLAVIAEWKERKND